MEASILRISASASEATLVSSLEHASTAGFTWDCVPGDSPKYSMIRMSGSTPLRIKAAE